MANLIVNPTSIEITDKNQNTVTVNFTSSEILTDVKLSTDGGNTYKDKISMTQANATFDITGLLNNTYACKLKGIYTLEIDEIISVTGIAIDEWDVKLSAGQSRQMIASVVPSNATNKNINWVSSNTYVADVTSTGLIVAKNQGYSKVTATTEEGGFTYDIHINVSASNENNGLGAEYEASCTSEYILDKMYPMGQSHEAIPNGLIADTWKYNTRWENQYRPTAVAHSCGQSGCPGTGAFQALGCWSNVYRVEGTPFSQNTGVEMKDIKVYGWYNGAWELVQHLPVPNGNFYPESFGGDVNMYFADSVKQTSTSKTIILREANKIQAMNWSTGQLQTENCMYHPFSDIKSFDTKYEYIYTCIDLRKVKWDENGVDDRDQTHYCSNCGGDWWLAEGLMFHDSWQHNKGVCQPKMIEITNEWRRFSMTTVTQHWSNGFPK